MAEYRLDLMKPLREGERRIPKSRYDSVDLYISDDWTNRPEYNDTEIVYNEAVFDRLQCHGRKDISLLRPLDKSFHRP